MPTKKKVKPNAQAFARAMDDLLARRPHLNEKSLAKYLGVVPSTVTKWIEGESRPSLSHLCELLNSEKFALGAAEREDSIHAWLSAQGATEDGIHMIMAREQLATALAERDLLRRTVACHKHLEILDRDLFALMSASPTADASSPLLVGANAFIFNIFAAVCSFFGAGEVHRPCIYIPDAIDPSYLVISPWQIVGSISRRANRCYCGPDPVPLGAQRGITGMVWFTGKGKCVPDVNKDDDFREFYDPPRSHRPYNSLAQTLILAPDDGRKLGVFCLDSSLYTFQPHDLALVDLFAARLGRTLAIIETTASAGISDARAHLPQPSAE